jgi:hypothetical protein
MIVLSSAHRHKTARSGRAIQEHSRSRRDDFADWVKAAASVQCRRVHESRFHDQSPWQEKTEKTLITPPERTTRREEHQERCRWAANDPTYAVR